MKTIINGKLYNTLTATLVGEYDNGYLPKDSKYMEEELYRKKTGEYFLYGRGGGLSKYAEHEGNYRTEGSAVIPLTVEEAKYWVEKHLSVNTYIKLFGEPEE
ncbi:MAG: hypothetical protein GX625_10680 [Clostridiaceae bacterium]|nr:hypothetical protein [Clostridiaceae bacterium]